MELDSHLMEFRHRFFLFILLSRSASADMSLDEMNARLYRMKGNNTNKPAFEKICSVTGDIFLPYCIESCHIILNTEINKQINKLQESKFS